jgi:hypothetical protein
MKARRSGTGRDALVTVRDTPARASRIGSKRGGGWDHRPSATKAMARTDLSAPGGSRA